ncbi:hypothetical protein RYH80_09050 [Halobaculum sp. MBLA0147]|uniref:hypothetical protein n=1 Tax=Halobaculum sp. MBLA0147 TaxID=3079934 RepID=UPI003524E987
MSDAPVQSDGPFEEQRRVYDLLSQETRHLILQTVLGHPTNLPSLGELDHLIPKSTGAIDDQLDRLAEADVLACYTYEPNADSRDLPSQFYGPTGRGVEILAEYNYLRGLPVARAVYRNTRKPDRIERHESAPRPELPETVRRALRGDDATDETPLVDRVREYNAGQESLPDQVRVIESLWEADLGPDSDGTTPTELRARLDRETECSLSTVLEELAATGLVFADPTGRYRLTDAAVELAES